MTNVPWCVSSLWRVRLRETLLDLERYMCLTLSVVLQIGTSLLSWTSSTRPYWRQCSSDEKYLVFRASKDKKSNKVRFIRCSSGASIIQGEAWEPHPVSDVVRLARYPHWVTARTTCSPWHWVVTGVTTEKRKTIEIRPNHVDIFFIYQVGMNWYHTNKWSLFYLGFPSETPDRNICL